MCFALVLVCSEFKKNLVKNKKYEIKIKKDPLRKTWKVAFWQRTFMSNHKKDKL